MPILAKLKVKNGHQKDTCYDDIGLCAQIIAVVLGSIVNATGGPL